jgi:regulator of sigma E protease
MELFNSLAIGLPVFIILLAPLMFIHELGHFWAAKKAGIRVEEFGLGFPPRAITLFKRGETTYSLNWLPIGAFVRMTGEDGAEVADPHSFGAQSKKWRLITLFAGPFMNFVGAFVILTLAYQFFATRPSEYRFRIIAVSASSPAQALGVKPGDIVVSANSVDLTQRISEQELTKSLNAEGGAVVQLSPLKQQAQQSIGKPFSLVVERLSNPADAKSAVQLVELRGSIPATATFDAPLGVSIGTKVLKSERIVYSLPQAMATAVADVVNVAVGMVLVPIALIRQTIPSELARPVSVVGITQIGVELLEDRDTQGLFPFVRFAGLISMVLGLTNLLPFPALDGGRILFVLIEWIRGRRVDPLREQWVHTVGMIFLLGLSAVIIVLDIVNPINFR